jgi:ubiquinone biosynthesis protein UbiJ
MSSSYANSSLIHSLRLSVGKWRTLRDSRRVEVNPQAATQFDAQISATDRQIDRLVYELYGLTEEEIALVESA